MKLRVNAAILFFFILTLNTQLLANQTPSEQDTIRSKITRLNDTGQLIIENEKIAIVDIITDFYQRRDYQPAWTSQSQVNILLTAINKIDQEGLNQEDYHCAVLNCLQGKNTGNHADYRGIAADRDILLTDALLRLVYHLEFGKVVPHKLDPDWNFSREFLSSDPSARLQEIIESEPELEKLLSQITNKGFFYNGLKLALARYREIQTTGGWNTIPAGVAIKTGMQDTRIPQIWKRLYATKDVKEIMSAESNTYTPELEQGVKNFQRRHSIEDDGVIGKETLAQMNISVQQRIDQIRANLERIRWVYNGLGNEFVVVNIAGFHAYYIVDNEVIWKSRVQVGNTYRKTPVFKDNISYLVFNPTWTVPPTILEKDILPKLKKDRTYLQTKNMSIVDLKGNIIDPETVQWDSVNSKNFPYMLRQEPGPENALGRIKIMFPNEHLVYLHDTPYKSNFDRVERAFSSGCVRVEKPFELAELLLKDKERWNQESIQQFLDTGKTLNVKLEKTVPILLLYFTVGRTEDDQYAFIKDVYGRDDKIIEALAKDFEYISPDESSKDPNSRLSLSKN